MRILIIPFLLFFCSFGAFAYDIQYEKSDSIKVVSLLNSARRQPEGTNIVIYFARQLKGVPYVAHTLEVNKDEQLIINLRQLDCTTYVENVTALALCVKQKAYTFEAFCANLRKIRYRGGAVPHYTERLHYFTDWIEDNTRKGVCREVQSPNPPFSAVQNINVYYMSTYPGKYKMLKGHPEYVKEIAATERALNKKSYRYVPSAPRNVLRHKFIAMLLAICGPYIPPMAQTNSWAIVPTGKTSYFMARYTLLVPTKRPFHSRL